jgi:hypothetical protein
MFCSPFWMASSNGFFDLTSVMILLLWFNARDTANIQNSYHIISMKMSNFACEIQLGLQHKQVDYQTQLNMKTDYPISHEQHHTEEKTGMLFDK